jgi:hypothetical protein
MCGRSSIHLQKIFSLRSIVAQRCLWDIGRDACLWCKRYDVTPDEGLRALIPEGEGQPFSIRRFQDDMRLKLGDVFPRHVDHPPALARQPYGFAVTR